jgi:hypothetical protein
MRISARRGRHLWLIVDERGDAQVIPDTGCPRQVAQRGQRLARLVAAVVDGLLALDHQARLPPVDQRPEEIDVGLEQDATASD